MTRIRSITGRFPLLALGTVLILGVFAGTGIGVSGMGDVNADLAAARDRATSAEAERVDLESQNSNLESENADLQLEVTGLQVDIEDLQGEVQELKLQAPVMEVVGLRVSSALPRIRNREWSATVVRRPSSQPAGTVLSQSPSPGPMLQPGDHVRLVVAKPKPAPEPPAVASRGSGGTDGSGCTPGYSPCLPPASDYDCAGGSGDGPKYTDGVAVTGSDPYGLDADGDGHGCD